MKTVMITGENRGNRAWIRPFYSLLVPFPTLFRPLCRSSWVGSHLSSYSLLVFILQRLTSIEATMATHGSVFHVSMDTKYAIASAGRAVRSLNDRIRRVGVVSTMPKHSKLQTQTSPSRNGCHVRARGRRTASHQWSAINCWKCMFLSRIDLWYKMFFERTLFSVADFIDTCPFYCLHSFTASQ